jgi:polysaccharide export outer membrane protein
MKTCPSLFVIAMLLATTSATSAQPQSDGAAAGDVTAGGAADSDSRYRLRSGDVLELSFPRVPTFNQTSTVQPDGYVTLRQIGDMKAAGQTVPDLTRAVRAQYAAILRDPLVTIELKDFDKPYFIVAGDVEHPGKFDLRGETTVTQAVAIAGGLKASAKDSRAVLFRRSGGGSYQATAVNVKRMLKDARMDADQHLEAGDMLYIPKGRTFDFNALTSSLWIIPYLLNRF